MFLLRDVFDYPYDRIAAIVGKSEAATRQIATRARRHVDDRRPRYEASERRREELAERFFAAARDGDLETLESLGGQPRQVRPPGTGERPHGDDRTRSATHGVGARRSSRKRIAPRQLPFGRAVSVPESQEALSEPRQASRFA